MSFLVRLFIKLTGVIPTWILFRPKIYFEDPSKRIPHLKGKAILISNHTSIMDYFLMVLIFPFRCLHYFVGEFVFRMNKFVAFLNWGMGNINIDRNVADMSYMVKAQKILKKGGVVGIFPEGHFNRKKFLDPFKTSFIHLAHATKAPIIPIYIDPTTFNFFKKTRLIIGNPINVDDYIKDGIFNEEVANKIANEMRSKVNYLATLYRNYRKYKTFGFFHLKYWFLDFVKITGYLAKIILYPTTTLYEDKDTKNKWKLKYGGVVTANHMSFVDPLNIIFSLFNKRVHILTGEVTYRSNPKILTLFLNAWGCIRIDNESENVDISSIKEAVNTLKSFGVVAIFPEGHISRDGHELDYKGGAIMIAALSSAKIYPIIFLKKYKKFHRQYMIKGHPINLKDYMGENERLNGEVIARLSNVLKTRNNELKEIGFEMLKKRGKRAFKDHID